MAGDSWDPRQYERFAAERAQPFCDLLALLRPRPAMRVVDLGCGTGKLTAELHRALGAGETVGIDASSSMLASAAEHATAGLRFAQGRIEDFSAAAELDLVFSNAALHWVADHPRLLERLTRALRPGGQLAVQVPANHDQPPFIVAAQLAAQAPYVEHLGGYAGHRNVLTPVAYARLLEALGFAEQHVRLQVYVHRLPAAAEVFEWTKGTTLTGYAERLPVDLYARFERAYREALAAQLGDARPFVFPFQRILLWGER